MVGCVDHSAPYALNNAHEIQGLANAGVNRPTSNRCCPSAAR